MSRICISCGKHPVVGGHVARRGMARAKGGAGRKITGRSKRLFSPNLQRVHILNKKGASISAYVCTKCLKAGKVHKA